MPWIDVLLFIPLLPLGRSQKDHKIDEPTFEASSYQLAATHFDNAKWGAFAQFLTQHPSNFSYAALQPNNLSWVLVMRML